MFSEANGILQSVVSGVLPPPWEFKGKHFSSKLMSFVATAKQATPHC